MQEYSTLSPTRNVERFCIERQGCTNHGKSLCQDPRYPHMVGFVSYADEGVYEDYGKAFGEYVKGTGL